MLEVMTAADVSTLVLGQDVKSGVLYVAHTPKEESLGRVLPSSGERRRPLGVARTFVYRIHRDGKRCGWGWGACDECGSALLVGDTTLTHPVLADGVVIAEADRPNLAGSVGPQVDASWSPVPLK